MTKIDELMRLATDLSAAQVKTGADYLSAYEALKQALEAALKPNNPCQVCGSDCNERDELAKAEREIDRLQAALKPGGEPVATVKSWTNGSYWRNYKLDWHSDVEADTKLYLAPPAQTPVPSNCSECANADSWGLPDKTVCMSCVSGNKWAPLNVGSVNRNTAFEEAAVRCAEMREKSRNSLFRSALTAAEHEIRGMKCQDSVTLESVAAPPAQTPPRLTDEQINLCWHTARNKADQVNELMLFARVIETAVRKQAGWNDE